MVLNIPNGKLVATAHEVMIKIPQSRMTLQAHVDDLRLLKTPCMLIADGGPVSWSLHLGDENTLLAVAEATGVVPE